ncbi:fimbrillin family protein [Bacteroides rodentium]
MNKKLFLGMFAAVGMLLATSCSNDELDAVQSGNEATVSFTLGVEGGVQTRAISDGTTANRLVYAVFDKDGNRITTIAKVDKTTSFPATESITLAKGQTYKVAFWAQNRATSAYVLDDDMNLTIDYTSGTNNAEERDAFFKTETVTVTGNANLDVTLKRPFAQINVGVTDQDLADAEKSGIIIEQSKVVISGVADQMNLVDGTVKGSVKVEYPLADIPKEKLTVSNTEYNYLSMSYILPNPDADEDKFVEGDSKTTLNKVEFTFKPINGNEIVIGEKEGLNNVPVQRNWRTNIIGKLLTGDVTFNIKIDPIYEGENNGLPWNGKGVRAGDKYYATIAEAITDGETDIELAEGLWTMPSISNKSLKITGANKGAKIDLKEVVTLTNTSVVFENVTIIKENEQYVGFHHAGDLKYTDCIFENEYWAYGTTETFENCVFNQPASDNYNVWTYGAKVATFKNCKFNSAGKSALVYKEKGTDVYEANFSDCEFVATTPVDGKAAIEIDGSLNPYKVVIKNCTETGFALGSISGNSLWNIKKGKENVELIVDDVAGTYPVKVNGVEYGTIAAALAAGATEIELAEGTYTIPAGATKKTLKFIGAGDAKNTIIAIQKANNPNEPCDYGFEGSTVTFENLTIEANPIPDQYSGFVRCNGTYKNCIIKNQYTLYGTSSFEGCTFHIAGDKYNLWTWGASADFTKCTFNCNGKAVLVYCENGKSDITFTECVFNDFGGIDGKAAIETGWNGSGYNPEYNINISKCEVNGFDVNSVSGSNVWGNKNSMGTDRLNVVINGTDVY